MNTAFLQKLSSWQLEALLVSLLLAITAALSGGAITDWLGALAVFFTFMHGQISFDFSEEQERRQQPEVSCYRWSGRYFIIKEILWVATFTLLKAWPLLVGTIVFLTYPRWRPKLRAWKRSLEQRS